MKKIMCMAMAAMAGGMAQPIVEPMVVVPVAPVIIAASGDWTGGYAGAALGYGNLKVSGANADSHEGIAGVNAGYRHDFGMLVLGGELSYSKNDIGIKGKSNQINSTTAAQLMVGADLGRTLVYVAGGVSQANARIAGTTASDNGYFAGLGADFALNDKWTVGGEVTSGKYNDFHNSGINLKDTSLQIKLGYRF